MRPLSLCFSHIDQTVQPPLAAGHLKLLAAILKLHPAHSLRLLDIRRSASSTCTKQAWPGLKVMLCVCVTDSSLRNEGSAFNPAFEAQLHVGYPPEGVFHMHQTCVARSEGVFVCCAAP